MYPMDVWLKGQNITGLMCTRGIIPHNFLTSCCSALQCVARRCQFHNVGVPHAALYICGSCVAVCCSVLPSRCCNMWRFKPCVFVLHTTSCIQSSCVAMCCSQCVAVCCSHKCVSVWIAPSYAVRGLYVAVCCSHCVAHMLQSHVSALLASPYTSMCYVLQCDAINALQHIAVNRASLRHAHIFACGYWDY